MIDRPALLARRASALFVVILLAFALAACGGSAEPTPTPQPTATPTPIPTPTPTPAPAPDATDAAVAPASDASGYVVTEQQINDMLQEAIADQPDLPVSDLTVDLQPDLIVGTGKVALGFFNAAFQLSLRVEAVDGKVVPEVAEILLDGKPVAPFLQGQIDNMTAPFIEQASSADYGFYVESVTITDDEIRIAAQ